MSSASTVEVAIALVWRAGCLLITRRYPDAHLGGLFCEKCRRPGMKPLHLEARNLAERFTGERLDRIAYEKSMQASVRELREAGLAWIENHVERRLTTCELLETT